MYKVSEGVRVLTPTELDILSMTVFLTTKS